MLKQIEYKNDLYILGENEVWLYKDGEMIKGVFGVYKKPPVGLIPEWLRLEERIQEIEEAIKRYKSEGVEIPFSWLVELGCKKVKLDRFRR